MQAKPKSKSVDALSDKRWQNTWIWRFTADWTMPSKNKDRRLKIMTYCAAATVWVIVGLLVFGMFKVMEGKKVDCSGWETKPLDQVNSDCLKRFIK